MRLTASSMLLSRPERRSSRSVYPELDAGLGSVGPFELHRVSIQLLCFPGANIADLTVCSVVPALSRDRIGNGFAQLMRRRGGQGVERGEPALASGAIRIGHRRVEDTVAGGVVIAAKIAARR